MNDSVKAIRGLGAGKCAPREEGAFDTFATEDVIAESARQLALQTLGTVDDFLSDHITRDDHSSPALKQRGHRRLACANGARNAGYREHGVFGRGRTHGQGEFVRRPDGSTGRRYSEPTSPRIAPPSTEGQGNDSHFTESSSMRRMNSANGIDVVSLVLILGAILGIMTASRVSS